MTDEELIARLRLPWPIIDSVEEVTLPVWVLELGAAAADRIEALRQAVQHANDHADAAIKDMEALVKYRDAYAEMDRIATAALRKSEARAEQLAATNERLKALLREADSRIAWESVGMGNDFAERVEAAALTPNPVDDRKQTDAAIKLAALPQERQDKIKSEADRLAALDDLAHLGQEFDAAPNPAAIREVAVEWVRNRYGHFPAEELDAALIAKGAAE